MEIVIKIDDNTYKDIVDNRIVFDEDNTEVATAIINGTPLPEYHGDLKDINNLHPVCNYSGDCLGSHDDCKQCRDYMVKYLDIIDSPTIIEADKEE